MNDVVFMQQLSTTNLQHTDHSELLYTFLLNIVNGRYLLCLRYCILVHWHCLCGAHGRCRINPHRFLAECRKRRLNQGSFVFAVCLVVYFLWFVLCLCIFVTCIQFSFPYCLFVSNSQVIGCEDRPRNDLLYCVGRGVKPYSVSHCCSSCDCGE